MARLEKKNSNVRKSNRKTHPQAFPYPNLRMKLAKFLTKMINSSQNYAVSIFFT